MTAPVATATSRMVLSATQRRRREHPTTANLRCTDHGGRWREFTRHGVLAHAHRFRMERNRSARLLLPSRMFRRRESGRQSPRRQRHLARHYHFGGAFSPGGTVFQLTRKGSGWSDKVLYSFCAKTNCTDGRYPTGGLFAETSGALYGAFGAGGANAPYGGGTFRLDRKEPALEIQTPEQFLRRFRLSQRHATRGWRGRGFRWCHLRNDN